MLTELACLAIPIVTAGRLTTRSPSSRERPQLASAQGWAAEEKRRDPLGPLHHHQQLAGHAKEAAAGEIGQTAEIVVAQQRMAVLHSLPRQRETVALLLLAAPMGLLPGHRLLAQAHVGIQLLGQMVDPTAELTNRQAQGQQARGSRQQQRRRLQIPAGAGPQLCRRELSLAAMPGDQGLMVLLERIHRPGPCGRGWG